MNTGFFWANGMLYLVEVLEQGKVQILAEMGEATPEALNQHIKALTNMRNDIIAKRKAMH